MADPIAANPHLYALLIGVDYYAPNQITVDGGAAHWPSLHGCVADIAYIEGVLQQAWGLAPERTLKLTATYKDTFPDPPAPPPEPPDQQPTYANIVAAFQRITSMAQPGDQVYIHYSGHGGRAPTMVPALKGADGIDETLVPLDIGPDPQGNTAGRYLHGIEVAWLLRAMAAKGLAVTVVFDSCHSGGATRGSVDAVPRGSAQIDRTPRPMPSAVASPEELAAAWQPAAGPDQPLYGSGWLPSAQDYVLLAACAPTEEAQETQFSDGWHGVLTYWLADTLHQRHADYTYRQLYNRLLGKVHSQFAGQTPQVEGDADRFVLGSTTAPPAFAVTVMEVTATETPPRVRLLTGQAQGLRSGAQFALYPPGTRDFSQRDQRLALAAVTELGATESWATVTQTLRPDPVEAGAPAVLIDLGASRLRRAVRLVAAPPASDAGAQAALQRVQTALEAGGTGWLQLAQGEEPISYQVAVNGQDAYEIRDAAGQPIPNIRPALDSTDAAAAARVVQRLVHLATYDNIRQIDNRDSTSPLAGKLVVEVLQPGPDYDAEDPAMQLADHLRAVLGPGSLIPLTVGEKIYLRVTNQATQVLNFAMLDLQPDWSIKQGFPGAGEEYRALEPGACATFAIQAALPAEDYAEGTDVLKLIATVGPSSFRWMELPALDESLPATGSKGLPPNNPLEELMAALTDPASAGGARADVVPVLTYEWVTAQVELRTRRP